MTSLTTHSPARRTWRRLPAALSALLLCGVAGAQTGTPKAGFSSGSTGSDGALNLQPIGMNTVIEFDPTTFQPPLNPAGDNVFNFTTVTIPAGVTLHLSSRVLGAVPVVFLCSGAVKIDGVIDLNGEDGLGPNSGAQLAFGGAGGYNGGIAGQDVAPATAGGGPGGGAPGITGTYAGGGGFATPGAMTQPTSPGGPAYGNVFLLPLIGGSGGGGEVVASAYFGGGGGGAILIVSSDSITLNGTIRANGGAAGGGAGGGSGGAIRLVAPTIAGKGVLSAGGGSGNGGNGGAPGRIRLEAFRYLFTGMTTPTGSVATGPGLIFLPPSAAAVHVTQVGDQAVSANPTGSFLVPDVVLNSSAPVAFTVEAHRVPVGTVVHLTLVPETGLPLKIDTQPLAGTLDTSTAMTAPVKIPHGFSRVFTQATWTP